MTSPNRLTRAIAPLCLLLLALSGTHAVGSSDAAWTEFRQTLRNACVAHAATRFTVGDVRIDPFGSQSYGVAVITDAGKGEEHVCVYDKASGASELSGPLESVVDPKEPFSPGDAKQLSALRPQVRATLADLAGKGLAGNGQSDTVAAILDGKVKGDPIASFPPGPYGCTVWWYGFLDEGARRVGTHRCTVAKGEDGRLVIEKTTGDRLHAETVAWEDGFQAYAGRTWIDGQSERRYDPSRPDNAGNDNFGDKVGLVLRSGERLFLVSIDERGMTEPDPSFFEILELVPTL